MFRILHRAAWSIAIVSTMGVCSSGQSVGPGPRVSDPPAIRAFQLLREIGAQVGYERDEDDPGTDGLLSALSLPRNPRSTDEVLERLKTLPAGRVRGRDGSSSAEVEWPGLLQFQKIVLADTGITDKGVGLLRGMDRLEYLDIAGTRVTDAGLAGLLPTLPRLRVLILGDRRESRLGSFRYSWARVTDRGMNVVSKTKTLRHLRLSGLGVTDVGLAWISELPALRRRYLDGTRISDAGLVHIMELEGLYELSLANTKVTDAGLLHLSNHPQLLTVILSHTAVSDAGITSFAFMPTMKLGERVTGKVSQKGAVFLDDTRVTDAGLALLRGQNLRVQIFPERVAPRGRDAGPAKSGTPRRKGSGPPRMGTKPPAKEREDPTAPERLEARELDLTGSWEISNPHPVRGYIIEFGADGGITVRYRFGVSRMSRWSYRDGVIHLGGSIRAYELRIQGPWDVRWVDQHEILVTDPNGQELRLKRRTP